jgi:hypothetical protein
MRDEDEQVDMGEVVQRKAAAREQIAINEIVHDSA